MPDMAVAWCELCVEEKSPEEEKKREELVQQHKACHLDISVQKCRLCVLVNDHCEEKRQEQKKEWRSLTEKAAAWPTPKPAKVPTDGGRESSYVGV